ncbi:MAG: hypothetical protein KDA37_06350 [Planctomycetales bacterium]|nr:hypothetical protein [Planctomycetales bacterium]
MNEPTARRPRLSLPFTIVPDGEVVHLIAGEDVRYSLKVGHHIEAITTVLRRCNGQRTPQELLREIPVSARTDAAGLLDRLYGERVLVDGVAADAHVAADYEPAAEGAGQLFERMQASAPPARPLALLCQDTLDYQAALDFNRRCRRAHAPYLWATTGPWNRGYVSPVFWPGAGPCLACLLRHFQRLSPAPQLYDALAEHGRRGGEFTHTDVAPEAISMLELIARWKIKEVGKTTPATAAFRLHVVEVECMEVSVHRVYVDPLCPECALERPF